jgi:hypothetical protein
MKKEGFLGRMKNTFEKKKVITGFLSGHPSSRLTRQVDQITWGQLQAQILNETDSASAIGYGWITVSNIVGPCWALGPNNIGSSCQVKPNALGLAVEPDPTSFFD